MLRNLIVHVGLTSVVLTGSAFGRALPPVVVEVTRADLAAAYLEVDAAAMALFDAGVTDSVVADANRRFDAATLQFFAGRPVAVIRLLSELQEWMESAAVDGDEREFHDAAAAERMLLRSLRARVDGVLAVRGETGRGETGRVELGPAIVVERLYETPALDDGAMRTLIVMAPGLWGSIELGAWPMPVAADASWTLDSTALLESAGDGRWPIFASIIDGERQLVAGPRTIGTITIVGQRPAAVREALGARFDELDDTDPELRQARASFRARLDLLTDSASATSSAQFLADQHALSVALTREVERLEAGTNPYAEGHGDWWRIFEVGDPDAPVRIPARVIVSESVGPGAALVIALHGAGGDENMFPDGYGAGIIARLVDEHGAVLVSPSTAAIGVAPGVLTTLIETLVEERGVDPKRVVILGHSMGAGAAMRAVDSLPGTFGAWAAIGGAGRIPDDPDARGLIVLGGLDPMANPARLMPQLRPAAEAAGVEIEVHDEMGHTLLVGAVLPRVIRWLLETKQ